MKLLIPVGYLLAVACGGSDDSGPQGAIPSTDALTIQQPGSNPQALTVGDTSSYWFVTFAATTSFNLSVKVVFDLLQDIVKNPPTTVSGDTATWGPGNGNALDPHVYRLVVTGKSAVYDYHFDAKDKGADDSTFVVLAEGHSDKSSGTHDGQGTLTLHIDNWAQLNNSTCDRGDIDIAYNTVQQPETLTASFHGFRSCQSTATDPYSATYYYDRSSDGSGDFQFVTNGNVNGPNNPALESEVIRSRWNGDGSGRADAKISGGDLAASGVTQVTASECWDASFDVTYAVTDPQIVDPMHTAGAETSCPSNMQSASYAIDASTL
jgi:hypothetical protein